MVVPHEQSLCEAITDGIVTEHQSDAYAVYGTVIAVMPS